MKQALLLDEQKAKNLANKYIENKADHYAGIVEETNNFWKNYYKDCFVAAEKECLKSGCYLKKS